MTNQLTRRAPSSVHPREDLFDAMFRSFFPPRLAEPGAGWAPRLDVEETPEAYRVFVELPGIDLEHVRVDLQNDTLTISGEKELGQLAEQEVRHVSERARGHFSRTVTLPAPVEAENVAAEGQHGVLRVLLPKAQESRTRSIPIKSS